MTDELAAIALVKRFLSAMEARDLETARSCLFPDAVAIFPGGKVYQSLETMVADAKKSYRWIKKNIERADSVCLGDGRAAVYISGTLYGVNRNAARFSGIRFIDRFAVKNDLIRRQEVWNDLSASGVL